MPKHKKKSHPAKASSKSLRSAFKSLKTREQLRAMGKALRDKCPRESHAAWQASIDRADPIDLLEESSKGRMPELVPMRYGRMMQSPFTFYRGTALNMAADLATTPVSGLRVQACGNAHLCNFGAYATPERRVIADINDLDETLPAPWEWDVKRLAASLVVASRHNGHSEDDGRDAVLACVRSYREHMDEYGKMRVLDVWYDTVELEKIIGMIRDNEAQKRIQKRLEKARERSVLEHDFPELATSKGMAPSIRENPPLVFHPRSRQARIRVPDQEGVRRLSRLAAGRPTSAARPVQDAGHRDQGGRSR